MSEERILSYQIEEDILVKDFIKKNISRHFYKHSKNINAIYLINGNIAYTYSMLKKGDLFQIKYLYNEDKSNHIGVDKDIKILYEDDYYLICYKEPGLLSIPNKSEIDSVFSRLIYYFKDSPYFPHILSRLDKDTTGLVLVGKCRLSSCLLPDVFKTYLAITKIRLKEDKGVIDKPILKSNDGIKREINSLGKEAKTHYEFLKEENGLFYYNVWLEQGRTHQIRVHFSSLGSPLYSDILYGQYEGKNLGLICNSITLINPFSKKEIHVQI